MSVAIRPNLVVVLLGLDGLCPASLKLSVKGSHWWLFGWVLFSLLFGCFCLVLLSSFLSAGSLPLPLPAFLLCLPFSSWGTATYGPASLEFAKFCGAVKFSRILWSCKKLTHSLRKRRVGFPLPSGRAENCDPRITKFPTSPSRTPSCVEGLGLAGYIYQRPGLPGPKSFLRSSPPFLEISVSREGEGMSPCSLLAVQG